MTKDNYNGKPENEAQFCGLYTVPQHPPSSVFDRWMTEKSFWLVQEGSWIAG